MVKKSIGDMNGWVFIGVGFVVMAVSIFFYDTLKIFIAIGGMMTLYGLGKLSYDNLKAKIFPKEEEEGPVNLDKVQNPYLQKQGQQQRVHAPEIQTQQRSHAKHHQPIQGQQHRQIPTQRQQTQYPERGQPQHRAVQQHYNQGKYCHNCGAVKQPHHRFCAHCGARVM